MYLYSRFIIILSLIVVITPTLLSMDKGSNVEIFTKNGNLLKGELINVDSMEIVIETRVPKTSGSTKTTKRLIVDVFVCDSIIIPGSFEGATPIILSSALGIGAAAISISNSENNNFYVGSALGLLVSGFTYLFIDKTLTEESIIFTEVDKYPWKLKPYSRNYRSD